MRYMLDTDICIYLIQKKSAQVIQKFRMKDVTDIGISSITLSELEFGVKKSEHEERNRFALIHFLAPLQIVSYDARAARQYGFIRSYLEKQGRPIGPLDTLIAAHALSLDCIVVTNNEYEFRRVPNLTVENWAV